MSTFTKYKCQTCLYATLLGGQVRRRRACWIDIEESDGMPSPRPTTCPLGIRSDPAWMSEKALYNFPEQPDISWPEPELAYVLTGEPYFRKSFTCGMSNWAERQAYLDGLCIAEETLLKGKKNAGE